MAHRGSSLARTPFRRVFIAGVVLLALAAVAHPAPAWSQARSVWDDSTVPGTAAVTNDSSSVELGVKFRSDAHGWITGVRFYKGAGNSGIHIGSLWTASGSLLARVTFSNETASGWQEAAFDTAVEITPGTTYVVSYHAPNGHYAFDREYFSGFAAVNPPLRALGDGEDGLNGVFRYGTTAQFPSESYFASNYWVDVVFTTTPPSSPSVPARSIWDDTATPQLAAANDPASVELGVRFRSAINGFVRGVRFYKGAGNVGPHTGSLWTSNGALLSRVTFASETASGWQEALFAEPVAIDADTTYVVSYHAPAGHYAFTGAFFTSAGVIHWPLRALATGEDGANGVFRYGAAPVFPDESFNAANYWVDVVFADRLPARSIWDATAMPEQTDVSDPNAVELGVRFRSERQGWITGVRFYKGSTNTGVHVGSLWATTGELLGQVTFANETEAGWQEALFDMPVRIDAYATYVVSYHAPAGHYAFSFGFFADAAAVRWPLRALASGEDDLNGVFQYGPDVAYPDQSYFASNYWVDVVFTTDPPRAAAPPPQTPPPDNGPGGPLLVLVDEADPFGRYYGEILRAEGLNAFRIAPVSSLSATLLAQYDVVILARLALTDAQTTVLEDWVTTGGNLIAMRPDARLAGLLGLAPVGGQLADGYIKVDTSTAPGLGIVGETIQFHSAADLYTLDGATEVASLYADAVNPTPALNPAVSVRAVGAGHAAAFTYDLARSIVYTRQGNPAWAQQERDGITPVRSDDLFFGAAASDPRPDWVNTSKVTIPQADEQQRLLANLIGLVNAARTPLPRFWYLPSPRNQLALRKTVVVMTGDDHANGGTATRFDVYLAAGPAQCSVADWECVRSTSYIYPNTPLTDAQVSAYQSAGFEIALHVNTNCADFSPQSLEAFVASQLSEWATRYPSLSAPATNRNHCIVWSDWASVPTVELAHAIGLDTSYYHYPTTWLPPAGFFTGSGMPMRFADVDGRLIDVYQATTQMHDEGVNGIEQQYPAVLNTLLDLADDTGPAGKGFYSVLTANIHTDSESDEKQSGPKSQAIVAAARARDVAIISARQLLEWLDGRNASSFGSLAWNGSALSFTVTVGTGARNLVAMVPAIASGRSIATITRDGAPVSFSTATVKGVDWAFFLATPGAYVATYAGP